jgi:hypothetical protein
MESLGRLLMILGFLLVVLGALLTYSDLVALLRLGRLPGDIHIKRDNFSLYFPFTTCILISGLLTVLYYLLKR